MVSRAFFSSRSALVQKYSGDIFPLVYKLSGRHHLCSRGALMQTDCSLPLMYDSAQLPSAANISGNLTTREVPSHVARRDVHCGLHQHALLLHGARKHSPVVRGRIGPRTDPVWHRWCHDRADVGIHVSRFNCQNLLVCFCELRAAST